MFFRIIINFKIIYIDLEQRFDEEENFALLKQLKVSIKINCQFQEFQFRKWSQNDMYSLNNIIKNNKYKVAHQIRLVCQETQLAQITRKI
jgi:hypothetical protein